MNMGNPEKKALLYAFLPFLTLCSAVPFLLYVGNYVEDAFIVFRYAERGSIFQPFSFNDGEQITALTSPLHGLLLTAVSDFGLSPVASWPYISSLFLLGSVILIYFSSGNFLWGVTFSGLFLLSPSVVFWTYGGLETPILLFLISAIVYFYLFTENYLLVIILCFFAFFTRFDSAIFLAPVLLSIFIISMRDPKVLLALFGTGTITLYIIYMLQLTYGSFLPTSFFVKTPSASAADLVRNLLYISVSLFIAIGAAAYFFLRNLDDLRQINLKAIVIFSAISIFLIYALTGATKHMMFNFRFVTPYLAAFYILGLYILARNKESWHPHFNRAALPVSFVFLALCINHAKIYADSAEGVIFLNEGKYFGVREYREMISILQQQAEDIRKDETLRDLGRPAILHTLLGGAIPHALPDFYVYETLVSYRHNNTCFSDIRMLRSASDYIHVITTHGSIEEQLASVEDLEVVSHRSYRQGLLTVTSVVAFNPAPELIELPRTAFEACAE